MRRLTQPPWTLRSDFSEAPIFVCWETTKACLLACKHCRAKAIRKPLSGELGTEDGFRLIDQLVDFGQPYPALLLTGGDPLMRADFFDLVRYAKGRGIYVAVAASVTQKLSEGTLSLMQDLGVDILSVSLDGAVAKTHDRLRGITGTWRATVDVLKVAKQLGLKAQANTTVMRSNIDELPEIFHLVRESGAAAWEVFFLIRTGRGAALEALQPSECEQVMNFLYDVASYGVPVRTAEGPSFRRIRLQRQQGVRPAGALCMRLTSKLRALEGEPNGQATFKLTQTGDGKGIMFVAYNGEVYPSGFLPILAGKVPRENLSSIYRSNSLFISLRDQLRLKGRCGRCEYRIVCGGSRSRAYAERGDPFEEDPACPYIPTMTPS